MHKDIYFKVSKKCFTYSTSWVFRHFKEGLFSFMLYLSYYKILYFCGFIMWKSKNCSFEKNLYTSPRINGLSLISSIIEKCEKRYEKHFEINIFYWSHSEISLYWIQSNELEKKWKQGVENRGGFFWCFFFYFKSWYYVSTKVNPVMFLH